MELICKRNLVMEPAAIEGKTYEAWDDGISIKILNEQGGIHHFSKDPASESYYGNWFDLEVEIKDGDSI